MTTQRQLTTFFIDELFLGIDVACTQEIVRYLPITRVPLAPRPVGGLINLRGEIVVTIDVRYPLGRPERHASTPPTNVIVRTNDGPVSLLVDEVGDVLTVDEDLFEPPPETLRGAARELILGAFKLEPRLLLPLDIAKVIRPTGTDERTAGAHPRGAVVEPSTMGFRREAAR